MQGWPDRDRADSAANQRPPLAAAESVLVAVTAVHLSFLPWALGTMHAWSQLVSLGLSVSGCGIALLPRGISDQNVAPLDRAATLLRRPAAWAFLALIGYVGIQALNPAWSFQTTPEQWWLQPQPHLRWLPSSVDAPFERSNAWRSLIVFGSLALLLASIRIGFTRRKSFHALFAVVSGNAAMLALFGLAERLSGARQIFGRYTPSNEAFAATFIYPNHAGAYFYLITALACGLAWWHWQRFTRRREGTGPAITFAVFAALSAGLVVLTLSRLSIGFLLTLLVGLAATAAWRGWRTGGKSPVASRTLPLVLAVLAIAGVALLTWRNDLARERFSAVARQPTAALADRGLARTAAAEMFQDNWLLGWGAGCFRYGFTKYTARYPAIHTYGGGVPKRWEHVHCDWLEFPVELGVIGFTPLVALLLITARSAWSACHPVNLLALSTLLGCALVLLHASVDFVYQNPAVLLTWSVLVLGSVRWTQLDRPSRRPLAAV